MGDLPGLVRLSIALRIQPNDGPVFYKVDGQRFGQNRTIKLLTGSSYKVEVKIKPSTLQVDLRADPQAAREVQRVQLAAGFTFRNPGPPLPPASRRPAPARPRAVGGGVEREGGGRVALVAPHSAICPPAAVDAGLEEQPQAARGLLPLLGLMCPGFPSRVSVCFSCFLFCLVMAPGISNHKKKKKKKKKMWFCGVIFFRLLVAGLSLPCHPSCGTQ
ncbi:CB1 cannabinoid receptor-interacting protein 1 isoform X1 [Pipistrellus kuhlii]|uniref:CB1 cannabinoid receptor-interacting protein 1 isoform X1 n=1 Tax=Pipistrellus kuhlii TaxID=59472 RepID=UPI001E273CEC|nr:CB1 cannabinoid receptor-interacting protein 1 isoform X1 [Pipistrellus kuhlii]